MATKNYSVMVVENIEMHTEDEIKAIFDNERIEACEINEFEKELFSACGKKLKDKTLSTEEFRIIYRDYCEALNKKSEYALRNKRENTFRILTLLSVSLIKDIGIVAVPFLPEIIKIYLKNRIN